MDVRQANFLRQLDENRNKSYFARISILDMDENPIQSIEGRVLPGSSISIVGNSSVRRTCNISLVADKEENDLTDIDNLLSINKKIKIFVAMEKDLDYINDIIYINNSNELPYIGDFGKVYINRSDLSCQYWDGQKYISIKSIYDYDKNIIWFPMGVFVISQPTITNDANSYNISLTCKDKMALLNGELGGNLPTSVTFHEYDQTVGNLDVFYNKPGTPKTIGELVENPNEYNVYTYKYSYGDASWTKKYRWTKKYGWQELSIEQEENEEEKESENKEEDKSFKAGTIVPVPNLIYDIIQTAVANYGHESLAKIIINDVPREIKQIVRYVGNTSLYYNTATSQYTLDEENITGEGTWKAFQYNDDVGYVYTNFIYPGELVTNIGDNVCTVLDKIINTLGNYEYFYDIDGNFIFQEKRNYLNNSYNPLKNQYNAKPYYIDNNKEGVNGEPSIQMSENDLKLIGKENYKIDIYGDQKSVYTFNEGNGLIISYNNTPDYTNIKNDYHIWGKNPNSSNVIHYHIAIKDIPQKTVWNTETEKYTYPPHQVVFVKDSKTQRYTGQIRMLKKDDYAYTGQAASANEASVTLINKTVNNQNVFTYDSSSQTLTINKTLNDEGYTDGIMVSNITSGSAVTESEKKQLGISLGVDLHNYIASDWRAELYLQGLEAIKEGKRPDIYQQELLDLFDIIYEWGYYDESTGDWVYEGRFKTDTVYRPNDLVYWIDFLEPVDNFYGISVDDIKPKLYSCQDDKTVKIYSDEVPNCVILDQDMDKEYQEEVRNKCDEEGQPHAVVENNLYNVLAEGVVGNSAQEIARNLLYQYTTYNEVISLQSVPIYYLDINTRITVEDKRSGINGDYIINSISIPLSPTSVMSISASKALNRI